MPYTSENIGSSIRVTVIGSVLNVALIVLKLSLGILGHSRALVADGLHSMTDLITDLILVSGLIIGSKPIDESHHYGHGFIGIVGRRHIQSIGARERVFRQDAHIL